MKSAPSSPKFWPPSVRVTQSGALSMIAAI
jgi:hypothetical protein